MLLFNGNGMCEMISKRKFISSSNWMSRLRSEKPIGIGDDNSSLNALDKCTVRTAGQRAEGMRRLLFFRSKMRSGLNNNL